MPFVLAPMISKSLPGLWAEGNPYSTETIYDICSPDPKSPPVHYESHTIRPHSICHFDAPAHIIPNAETIDQLFEKHLNFFYGPVVVAKLNAQNFQSVGGSPIKHWEVQISELKSALKSYDLSNIEKLFLSFEGAEPNFYLNQNRAFTLSHEAAAWLNTLPKFNLFGTIWKSTDFQPGKRERPVHVELFKKSGIIECLDLSLVPPGQYFLSAFPLPTVDATESPVCPVLFTKNEIHW